MIYRRLRQAILILWVMAMIGSAAMVGGAGINDYRIHSNEGRALATVTGQTWLRTTVDFQDDDGRFHTPRSGLLYPSGLGQGQRVWVTYAKDEPTLVKVEGRMWTLSIIPALSVAAVSTIIAGAAWIGVGQAIRKSAKIPVKDTGD